MTFECATNMTGYYLFVVFNPSFVDSVITHITLYNGGEMVSLNLTAKSEVNGTAVTCFIFNMMFHHMYNTTEPAYVYIQGKYNNYIH